MPASGRGNPLHPFTPDEPVGPTNPGAALSPGPPLPGQLSGSWGVGGKGRSSEGGRAPRSAGDKELNKVPAPGATGLGEGSEGKVRAGARGGWGTGAKEHPVPAAGCARGEVDRGGRARWGRPGAGKGAAPTPTHSSSSGGSAPPIPGPSPRFFGSPRLRLSNEPARGPRIWFLGRGKRWLGRRRSRRVWDPRQGTGAPPSLSALGFWLSARETRTC